MDLATCFCGCSSYNVTIGNHPQFQVILICRKCRCHRKIITPSHSCHFAVTPIFDGYEIDPDTNKMSEVEITRHLERPLKSNVFDDDEFLDNIDDQLG